MCIYYPGRSSLTYNSGDHIFSSAIGGMTKLPKGYVSDQFNGDISRIERDVFRNGLPGFARVMDGPGKRGSLSPQHQKKSKISLMDGGIQGARRTLGYVWRKIAYAIPQVIVPMNGRQLAFSYDTNETDKTSAEVLEAFRRSCHDWSKLRCRTILSNDLNKGEVIIGIADDVEDNYNCFLAKHPDTGFELTESNLQKIAEAFINTEEPIADSYQPIVHGEIKFDQDHLRVFGKMAFNALAYIKGKEFMLLPEFDPMRRWISYGGEFHASWHPEISNYLRSSPLKIPEKAHIIMLKCDGTDLFASISLYNSMGVTIVMTRQLRQRMELDGFVCDWQNKQELRFMDLVARSVEPISKNEDV
jgi:hypothetical protein